MRCEKAEKLIKDFCRSGVRCDEGRKLESHVKECDSCRTFVSDVGEHLSQRMRHYTKGFEEERVASVASRILQHFYI